jgi:hypothetical protein
MKKNQVKIGGVYAVKVSGKVVPVRIDSENMYGGWNGTNLKTGMTVCIKSAQRLHYACNRDGIPLMVNRTPTTTEAPRANGGAPDESNDANGQKKAPQANGGAEKKMGGLDAAAKVLAEAGEPLGCKTIVERAIEKGYWKTGGKTPAATVYAAIIREIARKGNAARFAKTDKGMFKIKA